MPDVALSSTAIAPRPHLTVRAGMRAPSSQPAHPHWLERHAQPLAAGITVLLHVALLGLLLWQRAQPLPPVPPPVERTQLVLLPPRAPEVPPEPRIAPTPSVDAAVNTPDPVKPDRRPPTPPREQAAWALPPPQPPKPPQPVQAPPSPEASVAAAPPAPALPPGPVSSAPGQDSWEGQVMATLERHRRYPNAARARREQGTALIRVSIARDGSLLSLSMERSSGYSRLDEAALQTFRRAAPLPAVPAQLPAPQDLAFPVEFQMR